MTRRFEITKLKEIKDAKDRRDVFATFFEKCLNENTSIYLSDFISDAGSWGGMPLQHIGEHQDQLSRYGQPQMQFKIQVLRDEWGNPPKPGDKVVHSIPNRNWRNATSTDENNAKRMGNYDKKYRDILTYIVDEKGCITCSFQSAVHFLNTHGIHSFTDEPITKKPETSSHPVQVKKGSTAEKHVWYWRYKEITDEQYKELPLLKK